jgi:hypothetical protein
MFTALELGFINNAMIMLIVSEVRSELISNYCISVLLILESYQAFDWSKKPMTRAIYI